MPDILFGTSKVELGQLKLAHSYLYPIRTTKDFKDVDPLSSILGTLSKSQAGDSIIIQFLLLPISNSWQKAGENAANNKPKDSEGHATANPYASLITEKITYNGFKTAIRIAAAASTHERARHILYEIANSFSSFNNPSGNSFVFRRPILWQRTRLINSMFTRSNRFMPTYQILNVQ